MKKTVLLTAMFSCALAANASYLIWQVDSSASSDDSNIGNSWNAAMVYYASATADQITSWNSDKTSAMTGATVLNNYSADDFSVDYGTAVGTMPVGMSAAADIGDAPSAYAYYVELVNYDFSNDKVNYVHARSDAVAYNSLAQNGYITDSLSTASIATVTPWHVGGFTAVPEPTSALMMLLGAAMLGLKRKNRSLA